MENKSQIIILTITLINTLFLFGPVFIAFGSTEKTANIQSRAKIDNFVVPEVEKVFTLPKPKPALKGLIELFDNHQLIGLSDLHGCSELLTFVDRLVREPEFAKKVNDFTWESGNVRFQELMDDFILRGKDVSLGDLRHCWRENTQANTFGDTPALYRLLRTIRDVNLHLPEERRVRVLLIDPPVDWSKIRTPKDLREQDFDRETHMVKVLEREVYAKGRKALFFAGGAHLGRAKLTLQQMKGPKGGEQIEQVPFDGTIQIPSNKEIPSASDDVVDHLTGSIRQNPKTFTTPLQILEERHPGTTYNILVHEGFGKGAAPFESRLSSWPRPALAHIRGTRYGEVPPAPSGDFMVNLDGSPVLLPHNRKIQDNWDAVLFLGARRELTRVNPPGLDEPDNEWMKELKRRQSILGRPFKSPDQKTKQHTHQFFPE